MPKTVATRTEIIRSLRRLEARWPKDGTMIFAGASFALLLCDKHPEEGGKAVASFRIPSDGGDPNWTENKSEQE